jgi:hypothetical protein
VLTATPTETPAPTATPKKSSKPSRPREAPEAPPTATPIVEVLLPVTGFAGDTAIAAAAIYAAALVALTYGALRLRR